MKKQNKRNHRPTTKLNNDDAQKTDLARRLLTDAGILDPLGNPTLERVRALGRIERKLDERIVVAVSVATDTAQICVEFADNTYLIFKRRFEDLVYADHVAYGIMVGMVLGRCFPVEFHRNPERRRLYVERVAELDDAGDPITSFPIEAGPDEAETTGSSRRAK